MNRLNQYAKAIAAALVAGYALYQSVRSGGVTLNEWVDVAYAAVAAGVGVYLVPNAPAKPVLTRSEGN